MSHKWSDKCEQDIFFQAISPLAPTMGQSVDLNSKVHIQRGVVIPAGAQATLSERTTKNIFSPKGAIPYYKKEKKKKRTN